MSVNKYTTASGLQTLANGSRVWIGTKANHAAARQAGTLPTDCLICITDDDDEYKTDQVIEDSQMTITSGGVYDALQVTSSQLTTGMNIYRFGKLRIIQAINISALPSTALDEGDRPAQTVRGFLNVNNAASWFIININTDGTMSACDYKYDTTSVSSGGNFTVCYFVD
jgi:hypothetical protein